MHSEWDDDYWDDHQEWTWLLKLKWGTLIMAKLNKKRLLKLKWDIIIMTKLNKKTGLLATYGNCIYINGCK